MSDYLTRDLKLAISASPESAYNTMRRSVTDYYWGLLTTTRAIYIPDKEKHDDTGKIGTGREFPTEQRSGYISVPSLEIADELNIDMAALLLKRAMTGSADTVSSDVEASLGFYNHSWGLQLNTVAAGRQLPSSSMLWAVGGADYLWGGVCVESFKVEQSGANNPTYTATLVGSGKNQRLIKTNGTLGAPTAVDCVNGSVAYTGPYAGAALTEYPPAFPAPRAIEEAAASPLTLSGVPVRYMLGAETICKFTDDGGLYNMTSASRLKSFALTLTNNLRSDDRRPGDPRINVITGQGDPRSGHYINRLLHGDRSVVAEMTVMLDSTMREYNDAYNDTAVTSFTYTSAGNLLKKKATPFTESSADNQGEFELVMPKVYFRGVKGSDDNGDAILTVSIFPVDDLTNGPLTARILTNHNVAFA